MVDQKHPLTSKTVWVNVLALAVLLLAYLKGWGPVADNPQILSVVVAIHSAVNIVLRFVIWQPLGWMPWKSGTSGFRQNKR